MPSAGLATRPRARFGLRRARVPFIISPSGAVAEEVGEAAGRATQESTGRSKQRHEKMPKTRKRRRNDNDKKKAGHRGRLTMRGVGGVHAGRCISGLSSLFPAESCVQGVEEKRDVGPPEEGQKRETKEKQKRNKKKQKRGTRKESCGVHIEIILFQTNVAIGASAATTSPLRALSGSSTAAPWSMPASSWASWSRAGRARRQGGKRACRQGREGGGVRRDGQQDEETASRVHDCECWGGDKRDYFELKKKKKKRKKEWSCGGFIDRMLSTDWPCVRKVAPCTPASLRRAACVTTLQQSPAVVSASLAFAPRLFFFSLCFQLSLSLARLSAEFGQRNCARPPPPPSSGCHPDDPLLRPP